MALDRAPDGFDGPLPFYTDDLYRQKLPSFVGKLLDLLPDIRKLSAGQEQAILINQGYERGLKGITNPAEFGRQSPDFQVDVLATVQPNGVLLQRTKCDAVPPELEQSLNTLKERVAAEYGAYNLKPPTITIERVGTNANAYGYLVRAYGEASEKVPTFEGKKFDRFQFVGAFSPDGKPLVPPRSTLTYDHSGA